VLLPRAGSIRRGSNALQLASDGTFDASKRIKNVANPINAQDAATKNYVDLTRGQWPRRCR
jgi:hypothetical protein